MPVSVRVGAGVPVVVTGKVKAVPTLAVSDAALVMAGAEAAELTVSVKLWVAVPCRWWR